MHLVYLDDSYERPITTIAAIAVPADRWLETYNLIRDWRRELKVSDGILIRREFHATEFVAGRGRLGPDIVTKHRRSQIFFSAFLLMNRLPIQVFTSCRRTNPQWATDRLLTRLHVTMKSQGSYAKIISDRGKEAEFTRLVRRLRVYNPIGFNANNPTTRIIEDPSYRDAAQSYFVQLADFCAYGLLRREQHLASKNKYGLHLAFDELKNVVVLACNPRDPMGVIR